MCSFILIWHAESEGFWWGALVDPNVSDVQTRKASCTVFAYVQIDTDTANSGTTHSTPT